MKILIIIQKYNLNIKPDYNYMFPIGLGYISSVLKQAGFDVDCLNMNHKEGTIKDILFQILDKKEYNIVCLGSDALGYEIIETIINTIRQHKSNPKIILGGPMITTEPKIIYDALKPDYGVIGEGEETIVELIKAIQNKTNFDNNISNFFLKYNFDNVKGIVYTDNSFCCMTPERNNIIDLDKLPLPDYDGFGLSEQLDNMYTNENIYSTFNDNPRVYPVLASRSCPFQCTFCYHMGKYRSRSVENVMKELRYAVKRYKIGVLLIYDDCFSIDKKRLLQFCEELDKLRKELSWELNWTCQLIVNTVNDDVLKIMKKSGCCMISYGFESYSPIVLKSMRKYITPEQIDYAFKKTLENHIAVQGNFIFGDIAETPETAKITLDYWKQNCQGQIFLDLIQPYPGSKIYEHCIKKGLITDKLDFIKNKITKFNINMTKGMNNKEYEHLKTEINHLSQKYINYVIPISKRCFIPNCERFKGYFYNVKVKCPFCGEITEYKRCKLPNGYNYGFIAVCRSCFKRYHVVSMLQYIIYKRLKVLIGIYLKIRRFIRLKKVG